MRAVVKVISSTLQTWKELRSESSEGMKKSSKLDLRENLQSANRLLTIAPFLFSACGGPYQTSFLPPHHDPPHIHFNCSLFLSAPCSNPFHALPYCTIYSNFLSLRLHLFLNGSEGSRNSPKMPSTTPVIPKHITDAPYLLLLESRPVSHLSLCAHLHMPPSSCRLCKCSRKRETTTATAFKKEGGKLLCIVLQGAGTSSFSAEIYRKLP